MMKIPFWIDDLPNSSHISEYDINIIHADIPSTYKGMNI